MSIVWSVTNFFIVTNLTMVSNMTMVLNTNPMSYFTLITMVSNRTISVTQDADAQHDDYANSDLIRMIFANPNWEPGKQIKVGIAKALVVIL